MRVFHIVPLNSKSMLYIEFGPIRLVCICQGEKCQMTDNKNVFVKTAGLHVRLNYKMCSVHC